MIGNNGSTELAMVDTQGGITFIEKTGTGNVMVTVISFNGVSAHSRSPILIGYVVPWQYYGECVVR